MRKRQVLVIEDNEEIGRLLEMHLASIDCEVKRALDGVEGLAVAESGSYELIVLDLMLPGIDGLEICRRLRAKERQMPILMLTAKSSELDRVLGLELGADDYLTKPFSVLEFQARVKALFRRLAKQQKSEAAAQAVHRIVLGELAIDIDQREVVVEGRRVELTAKEFDLLVHFAKSPGRVMSRAQLLDQVWGYSHSGYEHTVNSHINRLRAKIEKDPNQPEYIQTVWGVGYRCRDPQREAGRKGSAREP